MLEIYRHDEPHYPSSDGEPMGENDVICWLMTTSLDMLKRFVEEYLTPPFRAYRLVDGVLVEREQKSSHYSNELKLTIKSDGELLRFYPENSIQPILTSAELEERAEQAAAYAEQQTARAEKEAARAAKLEEELRRLKGEDQ